MMGMHERRRVRLMGVVRDILRPARSISTSLDPDVYLWVEARAAKQKTSKSQVVAEIVRWYRKTQKEAGK